MLNTKTHTIMFNTPENKEFIGIRTDEEYGLYKAKKGTPQYEKWLEKYRAKRQGKGSSNEDAKQVLGKKNSSPVETMQKMVDDFNSTEFEAKVAKLEGKDAIEITDKYSGMPVEWAKLEGNKLNFGSKRNPVTFNSLNEAKDFLKNQKQRNSLHINYDKSKEEYAARDARRDKAGKEYDSAERAFNKIAEKVPSFDLPVKGTLVSLEVGGEKVTVTSKGRNIEFRGPAKTFSLDRNTLRGDNKFAKDSVARCTTSGNKAYEKMMSKFDETFTD